MPLVRLLGLVMLSLWFTMSCQNQNTDGEKEPDLVAVARDIIKQSGTCTLITIDSTGQPRARIMDPFSPEDDFVVWFGTNTRSRKVEEIRLNNKATLIYYEKLAGAYVSMYGTAEVIDDKKLKEKYWKKTWQSFYPDYPVDYCLIKFSPRYLELISEKHGITGDSVTWKPATIKF